MTDRLKIVRILARNVRRTWTHALRRRRVSLDLASLAPGKRLCHGLDAPWCRPVETLKKNSS